MATSNEILLKAMWPKRDNGLPKTVGEMTDDERNTQIARAVDLFQQELNSLARVLAILQDK